MVRLCMNHDYKIVQPEVDENLSKSGSRINNHLFIYTTIAFKHLTATSLRSFIHYALSSMQYTQYAKQTIKYNIKLLKTGFIHARFGRQCCCDV